MEVMIAIIVLAFGLLGFALLQTMNVRFVQSANYRTQATNLAYDLTEQMRSNRYQAAWYTTRRSRQAARPRRRRAPAIPATPIEDERRALAMPGGEGAGRRRRRGGHLQRRPGHRGHQLGRPALGSGGSGQATTFALDTEL
jgi:type IV pilus assembly protein PilV